MSPVAPGGPRWPVVLFDLDGTLTDPKVGITRGVQVALAAVGITVDDADGLVDYIGPPIQDGLRDLHGVPAEDLATGVEAYRAYYRERGMYENTVHDGVPLLLDDLTSASTLLGLATSKPDVIAEAILEHFGLRAPFAFVGGASLDGARRAKADVIVHTLDALGVDRSRWGSEVVIVGDREHDVVGARLAGIASIGVRWGYAEPGELEGAGADVIVDDVDALRSVLLGD